MLKTTVPPASVAPAVRAAFQEVDPNQDLHEVMTLGEVVAKSYGLWRFMGTVFWAFAGIALALGAIGIYGLTSHATAERTREVGIRMALGARQSQVLSQVMRQGGRRILIGTVIGLLGGLGIGQILSSVLFKVSAFDPAVYLAVVGLLTTVSLAAIFFPARPAARIDPIEALRRG